MKRLTVAACLFLFICPALSQIAGYPDFEIVESTPVGTILDNPDVRDARDVWLEMINGAKTSLDIEEFYVANQPGEPLDDIIRAVVAAGERGVRVRLIADSRMYRTYPETVDMLGKQKNITSRVIDFGKIAGGVQHAKYFIVDGEEVFLGSQNFDWRALKHIHEIGVRIRHREAAANYQEVFNLDWEMAAKNAPIPPAQKRIAVPYKVVEGDGDTLLFSPTMSPIGLIPDSSRWDESNIVGLIDGASTTVSCQFLTYSPVARDKSYYRVLNDALRRAAARGVRVKMIVSDWSKDHPTVDSLKLLSRTPNIELKFSDIPEFSGGYISFARVEHCKYLVADTDRAWIGTSNAEKSYFTTTRNVGVVVTSPKIAGILGAIFRKDWDGPYTEAITPQGTYTPREHGERK